MSEIPRKLSTGEEALALHLKVEKIAFEREYRFHPVRKWRFDFAFPALKLAVEIEGVTPAGGRHQRIGGMKADIEKYNTAALMGWRVLRYTTDMVMRGDAVNDVMAALR